VSGHGLVHGEAHHVSKGRKAEDNKYSPSAEKLLGSDSHYTTVSWQFHCSRKLGKKSLTSNTELSLRISFSEKQVWFDLKFRRYSNEDFFYTAILWAALKESSSRLLCPVAMDTKLWSHVEHERNFNISNLALTVPSVKHCLQGISMPADDSVGNIEGKRWFGRRRWEDIIKLDIAN
jgi:hypothetical protein